MTSNPSAALESLERWSAIATLVILVGIVIDALVVIWFRKPDETIFEMLAKIVADVLIGIGLIIEFFCILHAIVETRKEKQESDERVAEANARAKSAELEIARLKAPRSLSEERMQELSARMAAFSGVHVTVAASPKLHESEWFADQIAAALRSAGVNAVRQNEWATMRMPSFKGVSVMHFGPEDSTPLRLGAAIAETLEEFGVGPIEVQHSPDVAGRPGFDWTVVVIGEKP
jgi:hypothetical protein